MISRRCRPNASTRSVRDQLAPQYVQHRVCSREVWNSESPQLRGYSAVAVTVRYTHTNLDSKKAVVAKLESFGDNLVTVRTKMQQSTP
jgi:hypothetical protein